MEEPAGGRTGSGGCKEGCKDRKPVRDACFDSPGGALGRGGCGLERGPGGEGRPQEGIRRPGAGLREDDEGSDFKVKAKQAGFSD